jgi:hypothetical protein
MKICFKGFVLSSVFCSCLYTMLSRNGLSLYEPASILGYFVWEFWWKVVTRTSSSPSSLSLACQHNFSNAPYSVIHLPQALYNFSN